MHLFVHIAICCMGGVYGGKAADDIYTPLKGKVASLHLAK
jgi:hypothetical protein